MRKIMCVMVGLGCLLSSENIYAAMAKAKKLGGTALQSAAKSPTLFKKAQPVLCKKGNAMAGSFSLRSLEGILGQDRDFGGASDVACRKFADYEKSGLFKNILKTFKAKNRGDLDKKIEGWLEEGKDSNDLVKTALQFAKARSSEKGFPKAWVTIAESAGDSASSQEDGEEEAEEEAPKKKNEKSQKGK